MLRRRQGNAIIEAAFVFPILFLMLIGILETGRAWMDYNLLTHAVREGARFASVRPQLNLNDGAVIGRINSVLAMGGLRAQRTAVIYTTPLQTGRLVRVRAEIDFVPLVSGLLPWGAVIPIRTEVITRYEV